MSSYFCQIWIWIFANLVLFSSEKILPKRIWMVGLWELQRAVVTSPAIQMDRMQSLICAVDCLAGRQHVVRGRRGQRGRGGHGLRDAPRSVLDCRGVGAREAVARSMAVGDLGDLLDLGGGEVESVRPASRIHLEEFCPI